MANKRTYYAIQAIGIAPDGVYTIGSQHVAHGVQSVGVNTNFNLEQIFELGQLNIYENIENIPDVEVTVEKVLDGYPLLYHLATQAAVSNGYGLANLQNAKCHVVLGIWNDTLETASGTAQQAGFCSMSGMFWSSLTYSFPVDGPATESITLVGNNKVWNSGSTPFSGPFYSNADQPLAITNSGGVQRREDFLMGSAYYDMSAALDANGMSTTQTGTVLPRGIPGINISGLNILDSAGDFPAHVQSASVTVDAGREELFELGRRGPYHRFLTFPTEVRCDIEVITTQGDNISATEAGYYGNNENLRNETIRIHMREGTKLDLGTSNKLSSVSETGGDAGGGNVTVTYSYSNFNYLTVTHPKSTLSGLSAKAF